MKKVLFPVLLTLLISCSKKPVAQFSWEPISPKIGQPVIFSNTSTNAKAYDWTFGNGNASKEKNPQQVYNIVGDYVVTLTAYNGMKSIARSETITIVP